MKFLITGVIKVRDVIEAPDKESAEMLMKAKYPALRDKEAGITETVEMKEREFLKCSDYQPSIDPSLMGSLLNAVQEMPREPTTTLDLSEVDNEE